MSNNIVRQDVDVDKHGNWSLTNTWDATDIMRSCYEDRKTHILGSTKVVEGLGVSHMNVGTTRQSLHSSVPRKLWHVATIKASTNISSGG